jgi:HPt (histidine-containing phosphotransfer) domain-containing protein
MQLLIVESSVSDQREEQGAMSHSNEDGALPLVDEPGLQNLVDMLGADAMSDMLAICLADVRDACSELKAAGACADGARARRSAHKLAGVMGQYACPAGSAAARTMADSADSIALGLVGPLVDIVNATAAELESRLLMGLANSSALTRVSPMKLS